MMRTNESGLQRSAAKGARFLPPVALRLLIAALALAFAAGAFASSVFAQQSTDATLSAMTFNLADDNAIPGIVISPTFTSSTTTYGVAIVETIATVTAAPTGHASASYQYFKDGSATALTDATPGGTFQIALNAVATTIRVAVTAEDGTTTQDYTFHIYRNAGDHDTDDNGYIEVWTRPQLEAIYYDSLPTHQPNTPGHLGTADATALAAYGAAFPIPTAHVNGLFSTGCAPCFGYELKQDIDLADANWLSGLGSVTSFPYNSTLLGNGNAIQNLTLTSAAAPTFSGFMGELGSNGRIENLRLENVNITADRTERAGGLVGTNAGGTIRNVHVTGTVTQSHRASTSPIGGLVGIQRSGLIESSSFTGVVNGSCDVVGGLVGRAETAAGDTPADSVIFASHARARVISACPGATSPRRVGGLVGSNANTSIVASYAAGSVEARNGGVAGGLVGSNSGSSVVARSYAAVRVTRDNQAGTANLGGLVGQVAAAAAIVQDSYWDSDFTAEGRTAVANTGAAKTTSALKTLATFPATGDFSAWDDSFTRTVSGETLTLPQASAAWMLVPNRYPLLRLGYPNARITDQLNAGRAWFTAYPALTYKGGVAVPATAWTPSSWATTTYAYTIPVHTGGGYVTIDAGTSIAGARVLDVISPADSESGVAGHQVAITSATDGSGDSAIKVILGRASGANTVGFLSEYTFTLDQTLQAPLAPASLSATATRAGLVDLVWPDVRTTDTTINGYQVCQLANTATAPTSGCWASTITVGSTEGTNAVADADAGTLSYAFNAGSLTAGTTYKFWVRAVNTSPTPDLEGAASPVASVVPVADSVPSWGGRDQTNQTYLDTAGTGTPKKVRITLPYVTGGDGALTYAATSASTSSPPAAALTLEFTDSTLSSGEGNEAELVVTVPAITGNDETWNISVTATDADALNADVTNPALAFTITFVDDTSPTFGAAISTRAWLEGASNVSVALPSVTNGNAPLTYTVRSVNRTSPSAQSSSLVALNLAINSATGAITNRLDAQSAAVGLPSVAANQTYSIQARVTDSDGDFADTTFSLTIANDTAPAFAAGADVDDITLVAGWGSHSNVNLPEVQAASRGNAASPNENNAAAANAVVYSVSTDRTGNALPTGVSFVYDPAANPRVAPRLEFANTTTAEAQFQVTYRAHDADTNTADADSATITFNITIQSDATPDFGTRSVAAQTYIAGYTTDPPTYINLPRQVSSGNISTTYTVTTDLTASNFPGNALPNNQMASQLPLGLSYNAAQHRIQGTSQNAHTSITVTLTVRDFDGDTDTLTFTLVTNADVTPSFGSATIDDQTYTKGVARQTALTLPALASGSGGNAPVTYSVSTDLSASNFGGTLPSEEDNGELPDGLTFNSDPATRTITGAPTNALSAITVTYTATDADGDVASLTFDLNVGEIVVSATSVTADEEAAASSFTVSLASQPSGNVRVTASLPQSPTPPAVLRLRETASGSNATSVNLDFTTGNWSTPKSVYVVALTDTNTANESTIITVAPVTGAMGANYQGVASKQVTFTARDNDTPQLAFFVPDDGNLATPRETTSLVELTEGSTTTFDVALAFAPDANTRVTLTNAAPLTYTGGSTGTGFDHTFQADSPGPPVVSRHWATTTTVTVAVAEDDDARDVPASPAVYITFNLPDTVSGQNYHGLDAALRQIQYTVTDNDEFGVELASSGTGSPPPALTSLSLQEGTPTAYWMRLTSEPVAGATVRVTPSGTGLTFRVTNTGGVLSGNAFINFASVASSGVAKWDTWSRIYVEANEDDDADDPANVTVSHGTTVTGTADPGYAAKTFASITAAVTDDDTRGITLNPASLGLTETDADVTGQFTVVLDTEPQGNVTVNLSFSSPNDDIRFRTNPGLSPAAYGTTHSLTFTPTGTGIWSTPQTVTVRVRPDDDADNDSATVAFATASVVGQDVNYNALTGLPTLAITVTDDETHGVVTSYTTSGNPPRLEITESRSSTYTLKLSSKPKATVTITPSGTGLAVSGGSGPSNNRFAFTTTNWNDDQTVTLTATDNFTVDAERIPDVNHAAVSTDTAYNTTFTANAVQVRIEENDTAGITFAPKNPLQFHNAGTPADLMDDYLPISEGETGVTYTVELDAAPHVGNTVTVVVTAANPDLTISGGGGAANNEFEFSPSNWSVPQTVTIDSVEDSDGADDDGSIAHAIKAGSDSTYTGVTASLTFKIVDENDPGISASLTALTVTEGLTGTYTVELDLPPATGAAVTVLPRQATSDATDLTFYASDCTTELTSTAPLQFDPTGNMAWNVPQTICVHVGEDPDTESNERIEIKHRVHSVTGTDSGYSNLQTQAADFATVTLTTRDNDTPGSAFSVDPLEIDEDDGATLGTGSYTFVLNQAPTSNVTVALSFDEDSSSDFAFIPDPVGAPTTTSSSLSLTFTPAAPIGGTDPAGATIWSTAQTVTVALSADDDAVNDAATIVHDFGGDTAYAALDDAELAVRADDDEEDGVIVSIGATVITDANVNAQRLAVEEEAQMASTYTVALAAQPTENVIVTATLPEATQGITVASGGAAGRSASLTFTPVDWATAQSFSVRGLADDDSAGALGLTILHSATGSGYNNLEVHHILVNLADNDQPGVRILGPRDAGSIMTFEVDEAPTSGNVYRVQLGSEPSAAGSVVTVAIAAGSGLTVNPTSLTFTQGVARGDPGNWQTPQEVTITGASDSTANAADETLAITHTADSTSSPPAPEYQNTAQQTIASSLSVTVRDRPVVTSVAFTSDPKGGAQSDTYTRGENVKVTVTYNRAVTVTGEPQLPIRFGPAAQPANRNAAYASGSGAAELVFSYAVLQGDRDDDGLSIAGDAEITGGTITETSADATAQFRASDPRAAARNQPGIAIAVGHKANGELLLVPELTSYAVQGAARTIGFGETIEVKASFNDIRVKVIPAPMTGALPTLALTIGANTRQAQCAAVSADDASDEITCSYIVTAADADANGLSIAQGALVLNGAVIRHKDSDDTAYDADLSPATPVMLSDDSDRPINGESSNLQTLTVTLSPAPTPPAQQPTINLTALETNYRVTLPDDSTATSAEIAYTGPDGVVTAPAVAPAVSVDPASPQTLMPLAVGENRAMISSRGAGQNAVARTYLVTIVKPGDANADLRALEARTTATGDNLLQMLRPDKGAEDTWMRRTYQAMHPTGDMGEFPRAQATLALTLRLSDPGTTTDRRATAVVRHYRSVNSEGEPTGSYETVALGALDAEGKQTASLPLRAGDNYFAVIVSPQSGPSRTYVVAAQRAGDPVHLQTLRVTGGALRPSFARDAYRYTLSTLNNVRSVTVTPTAETGATITVNNRTTPSGRGVSVGLDVGANTIRVVVSKEGFDPSTYTITVTRGQPARPTFTGGGGVGPGPQPTPSPTPTPTPTPTPAPTPGPTPSPSPSPTPTAPPTPSPTPEPSPSPSPTPPPSPSPTAPPSTPEPATPEPATATPTAPPPPPTPTPTLAPTATATPVAATPVAPTPTPTPEPDATATPTPSLPPPAPTATPGPAAPSGMPNAALIAAGVIAVAVIVGGASALLIIRRR